jgi:hypothetical protein
VKFVSFFTWILALSLILSACGTPEVPAEPTLNPADLQGTVAAGAFTMVAQTQAALPTATLPPPTPTATHTPHPTPTVRPAPAAEGTLPPAPTNNSGAGDPCIDQVLPATLQGEPVHMRIDNSTRATVSVSVYLQQSGPGAVCGYRSYSLAPAEYVVINNLVEGCYTVWAWNPDPDEYFIVTNGTSCVNTSNTSVFNISTSSITLNR